MTSIAGGLRLKLEQLVDHYVTAGSKTPDLVAALEKELRDMGALTVRIPIQPMQKARLTSRRTTGQMRREGSKAGMRLEHGCSFAMLILEAGPSGLKNALKRGVFLPLRFVIQVTYSSSHGHLTGWRHPPGRRSHRSKSLPLLPQRAFMFQASGL